MIAEFPHPNERGDDPDSGPPKAARSSGMNGTVYGPDELRAGCR
jgi:hypothetical protein